MSVSPDGGLVVARHGLAFTAAAPDKLHALSRISILVDLETSTDGEGSLEKIVGYFINQEEKNFFVGQWKDGMEFNVRSERNPRGSIFGTDGVLTKDKRTKCVVVYDGQKMHFYADGKLVRRDNRGPLSFGNWSKDYPLVIGSDGNGRAQWKGTIYEVAIFDKALSPREVQGFKGSRVQGEEGFRGSRVQGEEGFKGSRVQGEEGSKGRRVQGEEGYKGERVQGSKGEKEKEDKRPLIHYVFKPEFTYETEFRGKRAVGVKDLGKAEPADLVIPERFEPYKRIYLGWEGDWFKRGADWEDVVVNIIGFIPFGALLFMQFINRRAVSVPVQGSKGPGVQGEDGDKGSGVQGFKGSRVQGEDKQIEQQAASHKQQGGGAGYRLQATGDRPKATGDRKKDNDEIATGPRPLAMTQRDMMLAVGLAVVVGFAVSFAIEYLQAYLPSRDSSLRDLVTNVLGTFIGAVIAAWYSRKGFGLPASGFGTRE